ncbi:MAG: SpoIIE family protein phosphatase [Porcipelethomonas sp.]
MLKDTVFEKDRQWCGMISAIGTAVLSALLSYATSDSWTASVNCAVAAAVSPMYSLAVLAGSLLSYLITGTILNQGMIICSLILIVTGKWMIGSTDSAKYSALIAVLSMGFSSVVFGIILQHSTVNGMVYLLVSAVMSAAAYFIHKACRIIKSGRPIEYDGNAAASLTIVYLIIITALSGLSFLVINAGRIISVFAVLTAAKKFRYTGGSACGILSMTAVFICSSELGIYTVFLGIAGFAAGFFSEYRRIVMTAVFLVVNFCGQLVLGMDDASFCMQADAVVGCIVFMAIPERMLMSVGILTDGISDSGGEKLVSARMEFAAGALVDVRKNVEDIIKAIESKASAHSTVNTVSGRVCGKCRNKLSCWDDNFEQTNSDFIKIGRQSHPDAETFPEGLSECIYKEKIAEGFERCRKEEAVSKMMAVRLNESRNILFSQMEITESIISSMSDYMNFSYSRSMTRLLCSTLEKSGFGFSTAIAYYNKFSKLILEIYTNDFGVTDSYGLAQQLSYDMNIPLEVSDVFRSGGETRFRLNQIPKYDIEYFSSQCSARENEPTGDSCGFFYDGLGSAYIFISDGMGTGKQASVDSSIVSGLFKRLIRSGIDCGSAVKMINSIMLAKSEEESFATLDVCKVDLETGEMTLFKSGASSTIIRYDDTVMMFNAPSSPIGIIHEMQLYTRKCSFGEGNIAVMLSDGVDESLYHYIKEQLLHNPELDRITENVCEGARKKTPDRNRDDITVSAVRLKLHERAENMNFA